MPKKIDLTNRRFGRLLVLREDGRDTSGNCAWECQCDCGKLKTVSSQHLRSGAIRSCGCLLTDRNIAFNKATKTKHGMRYTRLYYIWHSIKLRCLNPNNKQFKEYGGRGITVCQEWRESFEAFRDWALANGYRDDLTIDREDNDGPYSPDNCRWATSKVQANNRRGNHLIEYKGETKTLSQWADELGIPKERIYKRAEMNFPVEELLFAGKLPNRRRNPKK